MRAMAYSRFGAAAEVLSLQDLPVPKPGPGEVLVKLHASGVNPSDVKARAGGRPGVTEPPFAQIIPHSDGAGVIEAMGAGVDASRMAQRVWIWNGQWRRAFGTAADYIAVPADQAVALPDHVSFEEGAVLGIPGLTAIHTVMGGGLVDGKTVLVSGGAGTVGHLAVQVAKASGARVLSTAGGEAGKKAALSAGADQVFDYAMPDLADQIRAAAGSGGVDRIVEVEFGQNAATNAAVLAEGGTIAAYGSAKDMTPELPFYPLMFKAVTLEMVLIYLLDPARRAAAIAALNALLEARALRLRIDQVFDLTECAAAHDAVAAGARAGSVILRI
ncbi:MAG: NADPH:quinone reductase [Pseudomonadota bacterium]